MEKSTLKDVVLDRILFPKPGGSNDSSFIIGKFYNEKANKFTGLGNISDPTIGAIYTLHDSIWEDNYYKGVKTKQLRFAYGMIQIPKDEVAIESFLVKNISGVGPVTARKIIKFYGNDAIEIIKKDPESIFKIKSLPKDVANNVIEYISHIGAKEEVIIELETIFSGIQGIRKNLSFKIFDEFGFDSIKKLKEDPYILTDLHGIGFLSADYIAINVFKIDPKSRIRVDAAIKYCLRESQSQNGDIWVDEIKLMIELKKNLFYSPDKIECESVVIENGKYAFQSDADNEWKIADKINELMQANMVLCLNCMGTGCPDCQNVGKMCYNPDMEDI